MYKIIQILFLTLIVAKSYSIELFGYKLYEDIYQYQKDGKIGYKKNIINNISIDKESVVVSNEYLNQYVIKSTKNGKIFEIHGSNNQLSMNPVECLNIQKKFIQSFSNKNSKKFLTDTKLFPNKLKSKTTWEVHLANIENKQDLIFSVTCDYSFNNRRMDIILSDINFFKNENQIFDLNADTNLKSSKEKTIDTSGI